MKAEGYWTWWNQYGSVSLRDCVQRAKELNQGVIVKWGYWQEFDAFKNAGIPVAIERYGYPNQPVVEATRLAEGIARGAEFAVINAEIEWEQAGAAGGQAMKQLLDEFKRRTPQRTEIYGSVDTRGNRTQQPYQQELAKDATGWMPMIYPKAFFFPPFQPTVDVPAAFRNSLDMSQSFRNKPVFPTIQTYDGIGALAVNLQLAEVERRQLPGCQAYTVCHATNSEWRAFVSGIPGNGNGGPIVPPDEELEEEFRKQQARLNISGKVLQLAGYGLAGDDAPEELLRTVHFVIHLAEAENED